jgi:hypothetical protein
MILREGLKALAYIMVAISGLVIQLQPRLPGLACKACAATGKWDTLGAL